MDKRRVNIFIALVLVLIIIAAVSAWATSSSIRGTAPSQTAEPTGPVVTPSVVSTPTPAPTATPIPSSEPSVQPTDASGSNNNNNGSNNGSAPSQLDRVINQSGSFESSTGTKMIMYLNWSAISQNSESVTIKVDLVLSTYTLSVGAHNGVVTINGIDYRFTSPGISYKSEKVRNNAVLTIVSATVTVPAGQAASIPVSASWDFYGTYGGVEMSQVTAAGTINIQG